MARLKSPVKQRQVKPDKPITRQLNDLIGKTIDEFGRGDMTVGAIADRCLDKAVPLTRLYMRELLRRLIITMASKRLRMNGTGKHARSAAPLLLGLEGLDLPSHIVVPHLGLQPDDENNFGVWRALERCTGADLAANLAMLKQQIDGVTASRETILRVNHVFREAGGDDDDVVGKVLRKRGRTPA